MIPDFIKARFETMQSAIRADRLAVMECTRTATGETCYVIVAVSDAQDDPTSVVMIPLGEVNASDNPFEAYCPPNDNAKIHGEGAGEVELEAESTVPHAVRTAAVIAAAQRSGIDVTDVKING